MSTISPIPEVARGRAGAREGAKEQTFRGLIRALGLIDRVMQPYFARFQITGAQWGLLRTLYRAEQQGEHGVRMTELSERLLVRQPSITGVVDRLEKSRWVVRDPNPDDMRAKHVRLTADGRRLVEQVLAGHARQIGRVLGGLNDSEQLELHRLLDRLSHHLEGLLDRSVEAGH